MKSMTRTTTDNLGKAEFYKIVGKYSEIYYKEIKEKYNKGGN